MTISVKCDWPPCGEVFEKELALLSRRNFCSIRCFRLWRVGKRGDGRPAEYKYPNQKRVRGEEELIFIAGKRIVGFKGTRYIEPVIKEKGDKRKWEYSIEGVDWYE